jgi:hypothetical protein
MVSPTRKATWIFEQLSHGDRRFVPLSVLEVAVRKAAPSVFLENLAYQARLTMQAAAYSQAAKIAASRGM